jgi:hypothetical protein
VHAAALGADPQVDGVSPGCSQQTAPGSVVLVVLVLVVTNVVVGMVVTDDEVVGTVVTVVSVVLVVLVLGGPQLPFGLQTASSTNAPPRLLHVTSSISPPMAHDPANWQQPPGLGGPSAQRPPPVGSA